MKAKKDITKTVEQEKRMEEFVAMAAHELKAPVTTIKGYCGFLEHRLAQSKDIKSIYFLSQIEFQTDRILNLVNNFLDLRRIETGKLIFQKSTFDIDKLVTRVVRDFKYSMDTHHVILQGRTHQQILADPNKIEQVLINLLSNAIKYAPQKTKIIVSLKSNKNRVTVGVTDFGAGIPKSKRKIIFERFYQINKRLGGGFGLGLYIASEIIKGHKGKIWVSSKEGQGSTFYFQLPI